VRHLIVCFEENEENRGEIKRHETFDIVWHNVNMRLPLFLTLPLLIECYARYLNAPNKFLLEEEVINSSRLPFISLFSRTIWHS
jgi:hypothetical protein